MADTDRLALALRDLRSDIDPLVLRPASDVRARGDQRARRRRAALAGTSALAVAAVVAGVALTGARIESRRPVVPPAGSATTTTPTPTPTASTPTSSATAPATPPPLDTVSGSVDPRLFLPAREWAGPDLADGHPTRFQEPFDPEGMAQVNTCDADTEPTGDIAVAQVADATTSARVGIQRVRTYASAIAARAGVSDLVAGFDSCQKRLDAVPDNNIKVTVTADPDGQGGAQQPVTYKVDVATKDGGPAGTEWVTVVADTAGNVSTIVINEPPATTSGWSTIRRIGSAAATHLASVPPAG